MVSFDIGSTLLFTKCFISVRVSQTTIAEYLMVDIDFFDQKLKCIYCGETAEVEGR